MKRLIPFTAALLVTGCASIFSGTTQEVAIRTTPGVNYSITNTEGRQVASGNSQGTATLERGTGYFSPHAYKARFSKPGYQSKTVDIVPGMNPWYFANILIGGVVGMLIVDPLTGAMYKFYPDNIDVALEPSANGQADTLQKTPVESQLQPVAKRKSPTAYSRFEYSASERAKAQGCKITDTPSFDGVREPHETLVFQCGDGRAITVICDSQNGCS